jgi:hypothetical protein
MRWAGHGAHMREIIELDLKREVKRPLGGSGLYGRITLIRIINK